MADTTSALPSPNEPVVDRLRKWSPIWYPWIKKLLETVRTQAAAQFQITQTIDEINGKYTIDLTEGGQVRGAVRLDGSGTLSEFTVLSDVFKVAQPSGAGEKVVFVVGTVGGLPAVGFAANMFVDGSITAASLDVDALSAIAANIGTVTAGVLRSSDSKFVIDLNNKTLTITT